MYQVIKRDGKVADFNISKIAEAIKLAFESKSFIIIFYLY